MISSEERKTNLKRLINNTGKSVAEFCRENDLDPSYISQLLNGHRNIGEKAARKIEEKANLKKGILDEAEKEYESVIATDEDFAFIPFYDAHGSCGDGYNNGDHVVIKSELAFKRTWLKAENLQEKDLAIITAKGDSMSPTISDGAILLINSNYKRLESGRVYAIVVNDEVRVKRLFIGISGDCRIASDNPNKTLYPDETINAEALANLHIIGRVVWTGGML